MNTQISSDFNKRLKNVMFTTKKAVRIEQQFLYLKNSVSQKTIPKGILSQCSFKCSVNDKELQDLLNNMMNFSASRILDTLIVYYQNWKNNLWSQHYQLLEKHKRTMDPKDYTDLCNIIASIIHKNKKAAEKTHTTKLDRDRKLGESYKSSIMCNDTAKVSKAGLKVRKKRRKPKTKPKRKRPRLQSNKHKRTQVKCVLPPKESIPMETLQKSVINLSNKVLTRDHLYVFYLGDSYAPTPQLPDLMKFNDDVIKWINSLRRTVHFELTVKKLEQENLAKKVVTTPLQEDVALMERSIVKFDVKGSVSESKESKSPALELFLKKIKEDIKMHSSSRKTCNASNLDKKTLEALQEMRSWNDIVIRLFDKGSGFFILDRKDYISRTMAQLDNSSIYEVMENQQLAIEQCTTAIQDWVEKYKDEPGMTDRVKKWILPSGKETLGNNYMDLKAHKPEKNYPGRLISTGCNTLVRNLAKLTAHELKKVKLSYVVTDINDFLQRIDELNKSGRIDNKELLFCTFDIEAMFPSISKDLGLDNCREHLNKRQRFIFSTESMLEAIEITLDHNLTAFNGIVFRQKSGAAMGGSNSCDYADIAMAALDEIIHDYSELADQGVIPPILFLRYRDDIFILYDLSHGVEELRKFFDFCNKYHPGIRFTMTEPSTEGKEFLNTFVSRKNGILATKPFSKECDSHCYLLPSSCHPLHTIRNIPYGIAHNAYKISSDPESYEAAKLEYSSYIRDRGYNDEIIEESFAKVEKLDRHKLVFDRKEISTFGNKRNYPLVCDFNPSLPPVGKFIHKYKYILKLDEELCKVIDPDKIFVSYRGNKTIKDLLVPSKLKASTNDHHNDQTSASNIPKFGCFKCGKTCKLCNDFLDSPSMITSFHTDQEFPFKHKLNCKVPNLIYKIDDLQCNKTSIGSSVEITRRWRNHKSHIRKSVKSCEIASHFSSMHSLDKEGPIDIFDDQLKKVLRVTLIDHVDMEGVTCDQTRTRLLKEREEFWQHQLKSLETHGGFNKRGARKEASARSYTS